MPISAKAIALGTVLAAALALPAPAMAAPRTRLVSCDAGSCLLVTGRRADAALTVTINGHAVYTHGTRRWRASLPVDTVREWSAPYARSITVAVVDGARETASARVDLPIGLLGRAETLAMLVVSAK